MIHRIAFCLFLLGCVGGPLEDEGVGTTTEEIGGTDEPDCARTCSCNPSPIVIDLTEGNTNGFPEYYLNPPPPAVWNHTYNGFNNNFVMSTLAAGGHFDVRNERVQRLLSWPAGWAALTVGWLALDVNGDGVIDNGSELFGTYSMQTPVGGAKSGFRALQMYDGNHDGKIDASDPIWPHLLIWRDYNRDGKSTPDELVYLKDYETPGYPYVWHPGAPYQDVTFHDKIVSIGVAYTSGNHFTDPNGNNFWFSGAVKWTNDSSLVFGSTFHHNPNVWDVYLNTQLPAGKIDSCNGGLPGTGGGGGGAGGGGGGGGGATATVSTNWPNEYEDITNPFATDSNGRSWSDGPFPTATCALDVFIIPNFSSQWDIVASQKGIQPWEICQGKYDAISLKRCILEIPLGTGSCGMTKPNASLDPNSPSAIRLVATSQPGDSTIFGLPEANAFASWIVSLEWSYWLLQNFAANSFSSEFSASGLNRYCRFSDAHGTPTVNPLSTPLFYKYPGCRWIYDYPSNEDARALEFWKTGAYGTQLPGYAPPIGWDHIPDYYDPF